MKNTRFYAVALSLASVVSLIVLAGCATDKEPRKESSSNEESQRTYPRHYDNSATPSEMQELDRQEQLRLWNEPSKR